MLSSDVLNPAREVAWATDAWAKQKVKPVIHYQAVAMLFQECGNELEDKNRCSVCANGSAFQMCVVTPILSPDNRTLGFFGGACSNCIWAKKAGPCRSLQEGVFIRSFPVEVSIGFGDWLQVQS